VGRVQTGLYAAAPGQEVIRRLLEGFPRCQGEQEVQELFNRVVLTECQGDVELCGPEKFTCDFGDGSCITVDTGFSGHAGAAAYTRRQERNHRERLAQLQKQREQAEENERVWAQKARSKGANL